MNVVGVVTEYNPFHNGHVYQLKKIKDLYPDSLIVIAMSGNFTQRGEISVINKWDKARIAVDFGVDVVLEIPFIFSNQSADIFSYAALKMLSEFKVDTLVFGSECNDKNVLLQAAKVQIDNPEFDDLVKFYIAKGENYPTSVSLAINELTNVSVSESNDLLAVSYIKEILRNNYSMDIVPIKRTNSFLDVVSDDVIVSATNIRFKARNNLDISKHLPLDSLNSINLFDLNKLFEFLRYKIISDKDNLVSYHLVSEGIHNRIYKALLISNCYSELVDNIKSKRFTYNKVNRILMNILVGFSKEEAALYKNLEYVRVLGMSAYGREYFSKIKKDFSLPVIVKFKSFGSSQIELRASMIYAILSSTDLRLDLKNIPYLKL